MIILKVGGGKHINWDYIAQDLKTRDEDVVIIHGANAWMSEYSTRLSITEKMITSPSGHTSRYTDRATMDLLTMVYSGLINKKIVACLHTHHIAAVGLTGADGSIWLGKRKEAILSLENGKTKIIRDSFTGNIVSINTQLLLQLIESGYIPVLTVPAITSDGELINIDNDRAVAIMAKELKVRKIVMLFEAPGLLKNPGVESSLIKEVKKEEIDAYLHVAKGRMKKKLLGVTEAFQNGVTHVYFGDGRIASPITSALAGDGTLFH